MLDIMNLLKPCLTKLTKFSIGCIEDLSYFLEDILKNLDPNKVTHLGLASVKDDPVQYQPSYFNPDFISPFYKLKVSLNALLLNTLIIILKRFRY